MIPREHIGVSSGIFLVMSSFCSSDDGMQWRGESDYGRIKATCLNEVCKSNSQTSLIAMWGIPCTGVTQTHTLREASKLFQLSSVEADIFPRLAATPWGELSRGEARGLGINVRGAKTDQNLWELMDEGSWYFSFESCSGFSLLPHHTDVTETFTLYKRKSALQN